MTKYKIKVSEEFEISLKNILKHINPNQRLRLAEAIDNLNQILLIFPKCYPVAQLEKYCEISYRKAFISKQYIVIYFLKNEYINLVNIFHTAQNWKSKILN